MPRRGVFGADTAAAAPPPAAATGEFVAMENSGAVWAPAAAASSAGGFDGVATAGGGGDGATACVHPDGWPKAQAGFLHLSLLEHGLCASPRGHGSEHAPTRK